MPEERPLEEVRVGNSIAIKIPQAALSLMLLGIMAPPLMYAVRQNDPTPTQLITAICISVFASILFLWILDSTAVFRFRSAWTSRSIYGIAISSILAATVGIYKDAFTDHLHPFDGSWRMSAWSGEGQRTADNLEVLVYFSKSGESYFGYSGFVPNSGAPESQSQISHLRIERFEPETKTIIATVFRGGKSVAEQSDEVKISPKGSSFEFITGTAGTIGSTRFVFSRP